jgi:predicted transcriptional regulator of viral defense system
MSKQQEKILNLMKSMGVIRPRDLDPYSIPREHLGRLCAKGKVERIARGLYRIGNASVTEHHSLAQVFNKVPNGILCLLSALWFHDITSQAPYEVWVAIDRKARQAQKEGLPIRYVTFSNNCMNDGVESHKIEGVLVNVFCIAKTVADCFKYRNKIGIDVAVEALRECLRKKKCSIDDLWRYAKVCRMTNVMRPYMEALTI